MFDIVVVQLLERSRYGMCRFAGQPIYKDISNSHSHSLIQSVTLDSHVAHVKHSFARRIKNYFSGYDSTAIEWICFLFFGAAPSHSIAFAISGGVVVRRRQQQTGNQQALNMSNHTRFNIFTVKTDNTQSNGMCIYREWDIHCFGCCCLGFIFLLFLDFLFSTQFFMC